MTKYFLWVFILAFSTVFSQQKNGDASFQKFTGKVLGNRVRLRAKPDLDGPIIRQLNKDDLLLIIGDEDQFWAVKVPNEIKAYVFRSYILDDAIEADRVNVRLTPSIEAPIIGQLNKGEKIHGTICEKNHKWLEITPPESSRFYISKEFVSYSGAPGYYSKMCKRKVQVSNLLDKAYTVYQEETKMPFESMTPKSVIQLLEKIIQEYSDFPHQVYEAKKLLINFQENYLEKKLAYIEEKSVKAEEIKDDNLFPKVNLEDHPKIVKATTSKAKQFKMQNFKGSMQFWSAIENSLYESWLTFNSNKNVKDFYNEQTANAVILSGVIDVYNRTIQNRPGDYLLKDKDNVPMAFLYSTKIDLDKFHKKQVKLLATPRPNNHFAYPAYFVLDIR